MKIGPVVSYVYGITVAFVIFILITVGSTVVLQEISIMASIVGASVGIGVFLAGLRQVSVVHEAVLTVFGKRQSITLTEGVIWIFPGIMGFIEVNVQEKSLIIGDDGKFLVIAVDKTPLKKGGKVTNRAVELKAKLVTRYKVIDVHSFLDIELETVEKNLVEYSKSALREYAGHHDFMQIITGKDDAGSAINEAFMEEMEDVSKSWGIEVMGLSLAKATPNNQTLLDALEMAAREEEEGKGEKKETDNVIAQVKRLSKELGISIKEARQLYQSERNKAQVIIYEGLENSGAGVMLQAQAPK